MDKKTLQEVVRQDLQQLTQQRINALFSEVHRKKTTEKRVDEVVEKLVEYFGILLLPVAQDYLYRARLWKETEKLPEKLDDFLEPPAQYTKEGRCNIAGSPVLYMSTHPLALVPECNLKPNDHCIVLQIDRQLKTEDLSCLLLGIDAQTQFHSSKTLLEMENFRKQFFGKSYKNFKALEARIHQEFVKENKENGFAYRLTSRLCSYYFNLSPDIDAIVYPSIATQGGVNNVAIRPKRYRKAYIATKVFFCRVNENSSLIKMFGGVVKKDNTLDWTANPNLDPPVPVGGRFIDPNEPNIYIAPWRK